MSKNKQVLAIVLSVAASAFLTYQLFVRAGDLNPSSAPGDTMHSLEDIYCKITNCATSTYGLDSPAAPASTMYTLADIYDVAFGNYYGKGWVASTTDDQATTSLTQANCEAAADWEWFEDGNGDGDTDDPEDGICVKTTTRIPENWGGTETSDNSYIMAYDCTGSFPNGTTTPAAANTCALCVADCYDGRKDLPDQGSYTAPDTFCSSNESCYEGPITDEVLKNWPGTRLPTFSDFYGYCGWKDSGSNYETGCSANKTLGNYGQMMGRTDECLDLSNSSNWEWLSERVSYGYARVAGYSACSDSDYNYVYSGYRFRAVFRP